MGKYLRVRVNKTTTKKSKNHKKHTWANSDSVKIDVIILVS